MRSEPIPAEGAGAVEHAVIDSPAQQLCSSDQHEPEADGRRRRRRPGRRGRSGTEAAERAILFQLLRDEHEQQWKLSELEAVLSELPACAVAVAIERLTRHGAVVRCEHHIAAATSARYIDSLGMIAI